MNHMEYLIGHTPQKDTHIVVYLVSIQCPKYRWIVKFTLHLPPRSCYIFIRTLASVYLSVCVCVLCFQNCPGLLLDLFLFN
jgi:hypothetical protein